MRMIHMLGLSSHRQSHPLLPRALTLALSLLLGWSQPLPTGSHGASTRQDVEAFASDIPVHRHPASANIHANENPCADEHAAGQGAHAGCPCMHASCGGFIALFDNCGAIGVIGSPAFIDTLYQAAPLPAHDHPPFKPPTHLNV